MRHQHYTAPELSIFHLDEASYTLLDTSPKKHTTENNDINVIGSPEEDNAHDACAKESMFLDEDDFDDSEWFFQP